VREGIQRPLGDGLSGTLATTLALNRAHAHTLLASYDDTFVEKLVRRINAYEPDCKQRMTMRNLRPILEEIRAQGYCYGENGVVRNGGLVAMLLLAATASKDRA
jgi:hypothetical protein